MCVCVCVTLLMRRIVMLSVACPALPYFSTLSHKRYDFGMQLLNIKCVLFISLQFLYQTLLVRRINERDMIKNVYSSSCKVPVTLRQILMKTEFYRDILEENLKK